MPKHGEKSYPELIGADGRQHALDKPFSDELCSRYLMDLGAIMALLPPPPARLLDLGAGTAWTSVFFAKRGYDVVAQDIAQDMIDLAAANRDRASVSNLELIVSDYESLAYSEEFDCATFYDSLHHAEDEVAAIASVYRALKPGGACVTLEPGEGHAKAPASLEAVEKFGVTERDMPPHLIVAAGRQAAFREFETFPRPADLVAVSQDEPPRPRGGLGLRGRLKAVFVPEVMGAPARSSSLDYTRITAIVRMRK